MWLVWLAVACSTDEIVPEQLNAEQQDLVVLVQAECTVEQTDPPEIRLLSNVGGIDLGFARITPGCGPVGTEHMLFVELDDEFQDLVDEARITAIPEAASDFDGDGTNDARDRATYTLERDGADSGVFAITLQSLGAPDETREDRWRVTLLSFPEEEEGDGLLPDISL